MSKIETSIVDREVVAKPQARPAGLTGLLGKLLRTTEVAMLLVVIFLVVISAIINPRFIGLDNSKTLTRDTAILGIAAIGEGFAILVGHIDLSVGSLYGLGGVLIAYFIVTRGIAISLAIPLTLFIGLVIGLIHGLFVTKLKMHGFLITLVSMGVARGVCLVLTKGWPIIDLPRAYNVIGQGHVFNIPVPVLIFLAILGATFFLLRFTYIGRQIYAVGGNIEAARLSGVNVDNRIILCFVISALCSTLVGMIQAGRLTLGHPGAGSGYELSAIASCIVGGLSFAGGEGSVLGIAVGAALMGVLQNAMIMLNVSPYWHQIVIGFVLLLAIIFDYMRRKRRI
jgi:ribose transport system permease protein